MKTRRILIASTIAAVLLAGTACGNDGADEVPAADAAGDTAASDMTAIEGAEPTGSRGETLALVMAVNRHEVAMAEQARDKGVEGDVLAYADMLDADHSAGIEADIALAQTISLSPLDTEAVQALEEKGEAEMARLAELDGEAYADAYVDAMVQGHTDALALIDERIGITANDDVPAGATAMGGGNIDQTFEQHLKSTRDAIARHLEMGEALQAGEPLNAPASMAGTDADAEAEADE